MWHSDAAPRVMPMRGPNKERKRSSGMQKCPHRKDTQWDMSIWDTAMTRGEHVPQSYERAAAFYRMAAERMDALGQSNLAGCYATGEGLDRDCKSAYRNYLFSSNQNHPHGITGLADCFLKGEGIEKDLRLAFEYFRKAADAKDPFGLNCLGKCYINGVGVESDPFMAVYCFFLAAEQVGLWKRVGGES